MLNFPNNPINGQLFTEGWSTWMWDGAKWMASVPSGGVYLPMFAGAQFPLYGFLYNSTPGDPGYSTVWSGLGATRFRFKTNPGDEFVAGSIDYRGLAASALSIVGAGTTSGNRQIFLYDNVAIAGNLQIGSTTVVADGLSVVGPVTSTGPNAQIRWEDRGNPASVWAWYASGGITRLHNAGDRIWVDGSGNLSTQGSLYLGGNHIFFGGAIGTGPFIYGDANNFVHRLAGNGVFYFQNSTATINALAINGAGQVAVNNAVVNFGVSLAVLRTPDVNALNWWEIATASLQDGRAAAAGVGGQLIFEGKYNAAGGWSVMGGIGGRKAVATDGDYSGNIAIWARGGTINLFSTLGGGIADGLMFRFSPTDLGPNLPYASLSPRLWRFQINAGDEGSAGAIGYRNFDPDALGIVGAGTTGTNRKISLYDNVYITNTLRVGGSIAADGSSGALVFRDRAGAAYTDWLWYAYGGIARLYNGADRLTVDPGGNFWAAGDVYAAGQFHCDSYIYFKGAGGGAAPFFAADNTNFVLRTGPSNGGFYVQNNAGTNVVYTDSVGNLTILSGIRACSVAGGVGQFHMAPNATGASYGSMWYNDGTNTYLLLTALNDSLGIYNGLRPLQINDATALVTIGHGLNVQEAVTVTNSRAYVGFKVQGAAGSVGYFFDDGNTHIEAGVGLWLNSNGVGTTIGGPLQLNGPLVCADLYCNSIVANYNYNYKDQGSGTTTWTIQAYLGQTRFYNNTYGVLATLDYSGNLWCNGTFQTQHLRVYTRGDFGQSTTFGSFTGNMLRFMVNAGDASEAGSITYRVYDGAALCIIGAGVAPARYTRLWDDLYVDRYLTVAGYTYLSGGARVYNGAGDPLEIFAPGTDHARIRTHVAGIRIWSIGGLNDGSFYIADESATAGRLHINTAGAVTIYNSLNVVGSLSAGSLAVNGNVQLAGTSIGFVNGGLGIGVNGQGPIVYGDSNWIVLKPGTGNLGVMCYRIDGVPYLQFLVDGRIQSNTTNLARCDPPNTGWNLLYDNGNRNCMYLGAGTSHYRNENHFISNSEAQGFGTFMHLAGNGVVVYGAAPARFGQFDCRGAITADNYSFGDSSAGAAGSIGILNAGGGRLVCYGSNFTPRAEIWGSSGPTLTCYAGYSKFQGDIEASHNVIRTGPSAQTNGTAYMNPGTAGQAGYFSATHPNGTRMFYFGYYADRTALTIEVGGLFSIYGGSVTVENGQVNSNGSLAGFFPQDRAGGANGTWGFYASNGTARIHWSGAGDRIYINTNSDLYPVAHLTSVCGGNANAWVNVISGAFSNPSDPSLKQDIEPAPPALDRVRALPVVTYRWKQGSDTKRRHYGFLSTDVGAALGDEFGGLHRDEQSGLDAIAINEMNAVLWRALQELAAEVETLKANALKMEANRNGSLQ